MDAARLGGDVRLLRGERGWTQGRLAQTAGVSGWVVYRIERGHADDLPLASVDAVVRALDAFLSVRILWHGEGLDRLRDRAHAELVDTLVGLLRSEGWTVEPEVSFSVYGERGSIDILAFHAATGALLVIEVKTVIPDLGGMFATLDRKVRLAPDLARARGWGVRSVSRLLVVGEGTTQRRRVREHAATFQAALPMRNAAVRRWLRGPDGPLAGLMFLPIPRPHTARRVRRSGSPRTARRPSTKPVSRRGSG